ERRLLLLGRDQTELEHPPEHVAAPRRGVRRARDRVHDRWALRNAREDRDLGQRQLIELLVEVGLRGRDDAVRLIAKERRIEEELEDLLLRELALDPEREDQLLE